MKGLIIAGSYGKILARQKAEKSLEIGELLFAEKDNQKILLQVKEVSYGSQLSQQNLELLSGIQLEEGTPLEFHDKTLRNYALATLKSLIAIKEGKICKNKNLPPFLATLSEPRKEDFVFLSNPDTPLSIGNLRSGSKELNVPILLEGEKIFSHHILVPATTGRGKSNLTSCILWESLDKDYVGALVLDPHDEYFGRNKKGLKDHPKKENVVYYTPHDPPPGARSLKVNIENLKPYHFQGVTHFSDPQQQALYAYYKKYGKDWIKRVFEDKELDVKDAFQEATMTVVKRKLLSLLNLDLEDKKAYAKGIFSIDSGKTTLSDICNDLEAAKTVIIDTSSFSGATELLIGSLVSTEILNRYKYHKKSGQLDKKPVISIVLEEAPRVLGKEVLEKGSNIFATIAREGRKFKVGLFAITQLPSLIPREILANMNTKIILGLEMAPERQALIDSASQDLSDDSMAIASLDIGEAIITSNFTKFAIPVKIPFFDDLVKETPQTKMNFSGMKMG